MAHVLDSGGATVYRNDNLEVSDTYTQKAIGGAVALFSQYDGSAPTEACDIGEVLVYDSALSSADRGNVQDYFNTKWSVY